MKRRHNLRIIRDKRSYSFRELAETLGIHVRTVQTWYQNGLPTIEDTAYPILVLGRDAKQYLKTLSDSKKTKLKKGQCYCVACHQAVYPENSEIRANNRKMGRGKESISIIGKCPHCDRKVTRFGSRDISNLKDKEVPSVVDEALKDLPLFSQFL